MTMGPFEFRLICDELRITQTNMAKWMGLTVRSSAKYAAHGCHGAPERLVRLSLALYREFGLNLDDQDKVMRAHMNLRFEGAAPPPELSKRRMLPRSKVVRS